MNLRNATAKAGHVWYFMMGTAGRSVEQDRSAMDSTSVSDAKLTESAPLGENLQLRRSFRVALLIGTIVASLVNWVIIEEVADLPLFSSASRATPPILNAPWLPRSVSVLASKLPSHFSSEQAALAMIGSATAVVFACAGMWTARPRLAVPILMASLTIGCIAGLAAIGCGALIERACTLLGISMGLPGQQLFRPVLRGILMHAAMWSLVGLGAGMAAAIGLNGITGLSRPVKGAIIGGMLSALLYPLPGAVLFPVEQTDWLMPTGSANRLLWLALGVSLVAVGVYRSVAHVDRH